MQDPKQWSEHTTSSAESSPDISEIASQTKQKVVETMEEVKHGAKSKFVEQKQQAADRLSGVAGALRQTSQELEGQDDTLAQYADSVAEQVDRMSNYLRERDLSALFNDVRQVAQRQPEIFVAGALAAGFLVGRFLKSSGRSQSTRYYPGEQYQETYASSQYANPQYDNQWGNDLNTGRSYASTYTSPETFNSSEVSRTDWGGERFSSTESSTEEISVTGEENYAG